MLANCSSSGNQSVGLMVYDGASAAGESSDFLDNQYGVQAGLPDGEGHGGKITLTQSRITGSTGTGVIANAGSRVTLQGCLVSKNRSNYYHARGGVIQAGGQSNSSDSGNDSRQQSSRKKSSGDSPNSQAEKIKRNIEHYLHRYGP